MVDYQVLGVDATILSRGAIAPLDRMV
jgi:hypothetical protein